MASLPGVREIRDAVATHLPQCVEMLQELIRIPSLSGEEQQAMEHVRTQFSHAGGLEVETVALSDEITADPDYSDPIPGLGYQGRYNLRISRPGVGGGRRLLFNTHVDVVPPSEAMETPWSGRREGDVVFGRGACDAKGQVATVYLVLRALEELGVDSGGDVVAHIVVEEENGGNGSLAMVRTGEPAEGCVVLEPTDGCVHTSIRGAVWFRLAFSGTAGHSGQAGQTKSALLMARDAMAALEDYHARLLADSRGFPLFDSYPNPMPLTFGRLEAGNWPASAPSRAVIEGVLGLLPNRTHAEVQQEMREALEGSGADLHFMYRHDSSVIDPEHPLPQCLLGCGRDSGTELRVSGMTASCDAWFYNNQVGVPTVVYGPGTLKHAHSKDEQIDVRSIGVAAEVLAAAALRFCEEGER